jgi:2-oxoglutarate ferredoxin oxidoreductase subunit alpha
MKPFPVDDVAAVLAKAKQLVLVEENYSGQLGANVREHTGVKIEQRILKFDGRPFSEDELVRELSKVLAGGTAEPVVTYVR